MNNTEIERKFLVKDNSPIDKIDSRKFTRYERYYLVNDAGLEVRIQKKGTKCEFEVKLGTSSLTRKGEKYEITDAQFEVLKTKAIGEGIIRDGCIAFKGMNPPISVKIYHGKFEGLMRAEVEFESEEAAQKFNPPAWCGKEITDTDLGRDSRLLKLSKEDFDKLLSQYSE